MFFKRAKTISIALVGTSVLSSAVYAQNTLIFSPTQTQGQKSKSNLTGFAGYQNNQMVDKVGEVVGNKYLYEMDVNYTNNRSDLERVFKVSSQVNDESQTMFSVTEANAKWKYQQSDLTVGRQLVKWSEIDPIWGFGKVNNRKNFNGFDPGQEGLTGVNYAYRFKSGFKIAGFGSMLYVPEMGAGCTVNKSEGTVTAQNPWCKPPTANTQINGENVPIKYNVNYPEASDVVLRYSAGLQVGFENKYVDTTFFAMRKPENQVSVSAEISFDLENVGKEDKVIVDVTPQFYYHDVIGANAKVHMGEIDVYGSAMRVQPNEFPDGDKVVYQYTGLEPEKIREDYVGAGAVYKKTDVGAAINYVARVSPFNRTDNLLAQEPRWNQAWNLNLYKFWTRKLSTAFDIKQDMITEDRLVMFRANYQVSRDMMVGLGVNSIGTPSKTSYWSDYANNDAAFASVRYIF